MKRTEIRDILVPHALTRIEALGIGGDLGNGTPFARALATVLAAGLATTGSKVAKRPADTIAALADDEVRRAAEDLRTMVRSTDRQDKRPLPGGAAMQPAWRSGVMVGNDLYVPIRDVPGLHLPSECAYLPSRPGRAAVAAEVARMMAKLPPMDVPAPTAQDIRIVENWKWRDTISVPMRGGPATTFLHEENIEPVETMLDEAIHVLAASLLERARAAWTHRAMIDEAYAQAMAEVEPVLAKARAQGVVFDLVGIDNERQFGGSVSMRHRFKVLGNDLKPAMWSPFVGAGGPPLAKVAENQLAVQRKRMRVLREAEATGGRGRIDLVTLAAVRALSKDPAETLRQVGQRRKLTLQAGRKGKKTDPVRLSWRDGVVSSSFNFNESLSWSYGTLLVTKTDFPQAVLDRLPGMPIANLVEHPFLQPDATIRSISGSSGGVLRFNVSARSATFDAETGELVEEAA